MTPRPIAFVSILLAGCVLQAGGYGGYTVRPGKKPDAASYGGTLQARLAGGSQNLTFHLGTEIDGHVEEKLGSLVLSGVQAGVVLWPRSSVALAPYLSYGIPAGWNSATTGSYFGGSVELPIRLFARTHTTDVNRNYRFLDSEGALVPFVRVRRYSLTLDGLGREPSWEAVLGLAVRTEVVTDLISTNRLF